MRTRRFELAGVIFAVYLALGLVHAQPGGPAPPPENDWQQLEQQKQAERLKLHQAQRAKSQARVAELEKSLAALRPKAAEQRQVIALLGALAETHEAAGELDSALKAIEDAREVLRRIPDAATAEFWPLGRAHARLKLSQGETRAAIDELQTLLLMQLEERKPLPAEIGLTMQQLGVSLQAAWDLAGAEQKLTAALAGLKQSIGAEQLATVKCMQDLAALYELQRNYAAARPLYEEALRVTLKQRGADDLATALARRALGRVLLAQGDPRRASEEFEAALKLQLSSPGEFNEETAATLHACGNAWAELRQVPLAGDRYRRARAVYQQLFGDADPRPWQVLLDLSRMFIAHGLAEQTRDFLEQVHTAQLKLYGPDDPRLIEVLQLLGSLPAKPGQEELPSSFLTKALQLQLKALGPQHPDLNTTREHLLRLEALQGRYAQALGYAEQARRQRVQNLRRILPSLSEREQLLYLRNREYLQLDLALNLALLQPANPQVVERTANWLLNSKALGQEALAARVRSSSNANDSEAAKLQSVRQQMAALSLAAVKPGQDAAWEAQLMKLAAAEERLTRKLGEAASDKGVAPAVKPSAPWIELAALQQALPRDAVFIDFRKYETIGLAAPGTNDGFETARYGAWITPAGQGTVQFVDLGLAKPIDDAVIALQQQLNTAARPGQALPSFGEAKATAMIEQELAKVAALIWKPLSGNLGQPRQLLLSPDGTLWLIPWAALPTDAMRKPARLLIEDYSLRYLTSGRDLLQPANAATPNKTAVVVGNPDYDLQRVVTAPPLANDVVKNKSALPRAERLPFTETEAQSAAGNLRELTGKAPQQYLDGEATELAVKSVSQPRFLVLATHGFFKADENAFTADQPLRVLNMFSVPLDLNQAIENPLLRCGLLLAGCNQPPYSVTDDGILTGLEIVGMDLRGTELVVLSACETGIGKVRNGEGVAGLRQAFQLAGAQSVVSTLWQVPDRDSALIMQDFFANLAAGQSKAEALRNAQLKRIAARKEKSGAAHPFFWAAWTVTGE